MKAAVWNWLENGGPPPEEIELLTTMDRYGAASVLGRTLSAMEIHRMNYCQNMRRWHNERAQAESWAAWAKGNEQESKALNEAMMAAENGG